MDAHQTAAFWEWFSQEADTLAHLVNTSDSDELVRLLSPRVASLGEALAWEVGPGLQEQYGFAVSPNGDRDMLRLTDKVVAAAPRVTGWEFHSGKPPKRWEMQFFVGEVPVDARRWRYVLTGYSKGEFYDVTLVAPNMADLMGDRRDMAGYLLLEGILGERVVIEKIGRVEVVSEVPSNSAGRLSDIAVLVNHLRHIGAIPASPASSPAPPSG